MTPCSGLLGRLFGHRFEGRYNEESIPPGEMGKYKGNAYGLEMTINKLTEKRRTYVRDVCRRCGASTKGIVPT